MAHVVFKFLLTATSLELCRDAPLGTLQHLLEGAMSTLEQSTALDQNGQSLSSINSDSSPSTRTRDSDVFATPIGVHPQIVLILVGLIG